MTYQKKYLSRMLALAMAIAMALTMTVSAFASAAQPYNESNTLISARISKTGNTYSATVTGPQGTTKTELSMTLYEKGMLGYTEVDSASASANSTRCTKTVTYTFKSNKDYKLSVTGRAYTNGTWDTVTKEVTA